MLEKKTVAPLVLIAFDGADDLLVRQWVGEGRLPTLASLMARGSFRKLGGPECVSEHGTPLSLVSGISRREHGYYSFRRLKPGSYDLEPFGFAATATEPFWACLRASGKRVASVDAPDALVCEGLEGFQLSGWAVHEAAQWHQPLLAIPAHAVAAARREYGRRIRVGEFEPGSSARKDRAILGRFLERVRRKGALCRAVARSHRCELSVFGFSEAHTAAHRFWRYRREPRADGLDVAIRDVYEAVDREIGLLLEALPKEANVFVASPYGIRDQYPTDGLLDAFCRDLGYHVPRPALARAWLPAGLREAISRRLPPGLQERLLAERLREGTDWSRTTAFAIPHLYAGFVRANLRGREPAGIVAPGAAYRDLLKRLEQDLRSLVDPVTGAPAVSEVVKTAEHFASEDAGPLPDLFVEWAPSRHFRRRLVHPRLTLEQKEPAYFRDSYHSRTGFIVSAGPDVPTHGVAPEVDLLDLAPTFLKLMGESVPSRFRGRPVAL